MIEAIQSIHPIGYMAAFIGCLFCVCVASSLIKRRDPIKDLRETCTYHDPQQAKHMRIIGNPNLTMARVPRCISRA